MPQKDIKAFLPRQRVVCVMPCFLYNYIYYLMALQRVAKTVKPRILNLFMQQLRGGAAKDSYDACLSANRASN